MPTGCWSCRAFLEGRWRPCWRIRSSRSRIGSGPSHWRLSPSPSSTARGLPTATPWPRTSWSTSTPASPTGSTSRPFMNRVAPRPGAGRTTCELFSSPVWSEPLRRSSPGPSSSFLISTRTRTSPGYWPQASARYGGALSPSTSPRRGCPFGNSGRSTACCESARGGRARRGIQPRPGGPARCEPHGGQPRLRVLDEKYHEKRHDRRARADLTGLMAIVPGRLCSVILRGQIRSSFDHRPQDQQRDHSGQQGASAEDSTARHLAGYERQATQAAPTPAMSRPEPDPGANAGHRGDQQEDRENCRSGIAEGLEKERRPGQTEHQRCENTYRRRYPGVRSRPGGVPEKATDENAHERRSQALTAIGLRGGHYFNPSTLPLVRRRMASCKRLSFVSSRLAESIQAT